MVMESAHQVTMAEVDGLVIHWIVWRGRAQIEYVFGGLYFEILLTHRTGNNRQLKIQWQAVN